MAFPAAEGVRLRWEVVPPEVRAAIGEICGSPVTQAADQRGGFSPGVAARVVGASGARAFVKVAPVELNPQTAELYRAEVAVLRNLADRPDLPAPRLLGAVETGSWTGLVVTDVDGRNPLLPWVEPELDRVLAAVERLGAAPAGLPSAVDRLEDTFTGWRTLLTRPPEGLDPWSRERLPLLAGLEAQWPPAAEGNRLVHGDLRADNVLLTAQEAVVVDWPAACRGAALLDLVLLAPSVLMQGGPPPGELLSRTAVGRQADRDALVPLVCAFAGYLTERALQPPPPGLPTVRAFQAAQAVMARRWLADLLS